MGGGPDWLLGSDRYGTIRLTAAPRGGKPLFVGIARTSDVDAYLRDAASSRVTNLEYAPFSVTYASRLGSRAPGRADRAGHLGRPGLARADVGRANPATGRSS